MYNSRVKIFTKILSSTLECFGNEDNKITFWNKLQGYGLKASDFDYSKGCSRRSFTHWKNFLLERKLIRIPRVKRKSKKDVSRRSSRGLPYVITPLGICYFSLLLKDITSRQGNYIIKFLGHYSSDKITIDWKKICQVLGDSEACLILKRVCDSIEINGEDEIHIIWKYRSREKIAYEFVEYKIDNKQIVTQLPEGRYTEELHKERILTARPIIDDDSFYQDLADFILKTFCYSIIENYHWKILWTTRLLNWATLTETQEADFKNTITKCETILENIPFEVHLTANNFISENIFGTIKQEQKLAKKISDYYYQKILPKEGVNITDDNAKPFSMFSPDNLKL